MWRAATSRPSVRFQLSLSLLIPFFVTITYSIYGSARGYRVGILRAADYSNLTQCETLDGALDLIIFSCLFLTPSAQISSFTWPARTMETFSRTSRRRLPPPPSAKSARSRWSRSFSTSAPIRSSPSQSSSTTSRTHILTLFNGFI